MILLAAALLFPALAAAAEKIIVPWSFKPLKRPALPQVADAAWPRADLDRFILARLAASGLTPGADAPRAVLIRRLTLDLHGLLPSPDEVAAFTRDPRGNDEALAAVVDRLLRSPRFGERWARHWLDVVRYAESTGRSWNAPYVYAFRYRDWVIDSLNADKPYTRFLSEQIAGDLIPARTDAERAQSLIGTGFLTLGSMDLQQGQQEQFVMDLVDDQIDVTTRAFMGLTIACARCHDHKTDPVTMSDYYALAGLFYSTDTWSGTADRANLGPNLYVDLERLVSLPAKGASAKPATPAPLASGEVNLFDDTPRQGGGAMAAMGAEERDGKGYLISYAYDPSLAMAVSDGRARHCPIREAGNPYDEGKTPRRGELAIHGLPPMPSAGPKESGRAQLAQWLSAPAHPLTARVMANRVWAHLFGRGIVTTVDDFGITGERPDHPELLDHLAVRFVEGGWSVKSLIRMIVLSRAYRQSSASRQDARERDPSDVLLWRFAPRRVEMEVLRDTMMQAAGALKLDRPAGIAIAGNGGKGNTGRTRSLLGIESPYRTIYLPVLRDLLPELHETWDFPNPSQIKGQRDVTTVPAQSLFLMNSRFVDDIAAGISDRVAEGGRDDAQRIDRAHQILLSRPATKDESVEGLEYLQDGGDWASYIQTLIGSAEFRYVF